MLGLGSVCRIGQNSCPWEKEEQWKENDISVWDLLIRFHLTMEYDICQAHISVTFNTGCIGCVVVKCRDLYKFPSKPLVSLGILDCSKLLYSGVADIVSTYKYLIWQTSSCFLVPSFLFITFQIYFDSFFCFKCGPSLLGIGLRYMVALVINFCYALVPPV